MEKVKIRVNSKRRLKEWEHNPFLFSFWQRLFHLERFHYLSFILKPVLQTTGLYLRGKRNAGLPLVEETTLLLPHLPAGFDNCRILFLTDLHIENNPEAFKNMLSAIAGKPFDYIFLGGDYRYGMHGSLQMVKAAFQEFRQHIDPKIPVYAVLGNHDTHEVIEILEQTGIQVLVNEAVAITKNGDSIWVAGVDDSHYYRTDNYSAAAEQISDDAFVILLSHSSDVLMHLIGNLPDLVLSGHTHGGQICLPGIGPLLVHSRLPRKCAAGKWEFGGVSGYTSRGIGTSGLPVRFNCPPEITVLRLKSSR